jgi:hypothetical protein
VWGWSGRPWSRNYACDLMLPWVLPIACTYIMLLSSGLSHLAGQMWRHFLQNSGYPLPHYILPFPFQVGYFTKLIVWRLRVYGVNARCHNLQHHIKNIHNHKNLISYNISIPLLQILIAKCLVMNSDI